MVEPLISIIIPTYNRRRWIGECLDAIERQIYRNYEVIVIDDRSTDDTVAWLRAEPEYAFARIHVQEQNGGASIARNTGVKLSRGQLITFIDSDDLLEPAHLETAVRAFEQYPNLGLFCCDAVMIGPDGAVQHSGRTWHEVNAEIKRYRIGSGLRKLTDIFLFSNSFPGFTLRRDVFDRVGGLDQSIFPLDDYDLALRVAGGGYDVYYSHEALARYRDHGGNSSGAANGVNVGREKLRCLQLALERNPEIRSLGSAAAGRVAEVTMELAITQMKAGQVLAGAVSTMRALLTSPGQARDLMQMGRRRLKRALGVV